MKNKLKTYLLIIVISIISFTFFYLAIKTLYITSTMIRNLIDKKVYIDSLFNYVIKIIFLLAISLFFIILANKISTKMIYLFKNSLLFVKIKKILKIKDDFN